MENSMELNDYNGSYDVQDVARYIINHSQDIGKPVSNLRLQKLLYFIQAAFMLKKDGEACFYQELEAWSYGPVSSEVYDEYKGYGRSKIPRIDEYFSFNINDLENIGMVEYDENVIDKGDRDIVDSVIESTENFGTYDLVDITHRQAPWREAYEASQNSIITKDSMREYFLGE